MSFPSFLTWCIAFGVVDIIVVITNILTLAVFFTNKRLFKKRQNQFFVSLAISDIMVGLAVIPLYTRQLACWWMGAENNKLRDKMFIAMDIFFGYASIFTLVAIALDRVRGAVSFPLHHNGAPKTVNRAMIASGWVLSALMVLAHHFSPRKEAFIYLLLFSISLSLLVICVSYLLVWRARLKVSPIKHSLRTTAFLQERRLAKLAFLITVIFVFTWLPFHILNFFFYFCKSPNCRPSTELAFFSKLLHYSNSFLNPVIYSYRNTQFRRNLKRLF